MTEMETQIAKALLASEVADTQAHPRVVEREDGTVVLDLTGQQPAPTSPAGDEAQIDFGMNKELDRVVLQVTFKRAADKEATRVQFHYTADEAASLTAGLARMCVALRHKGKTPVLVPGDKGVLLAGRNGGPGLSPATAKLLGKKQ